nr:hypothetical protein [Tanacetum cinerariifolium]
MRELREETFSRNKNEDNHDHVDRVLNIVSLFIIPGVSQDAIILRVFLFTLTGIAKRWVDRLTLGAVNTWDLLKKAFIQRYCPPSKAAKRLEDIHNFKQEIDESLYQAWERLNDLLYKCPTHDINSHQKKWHDETLSRSLSSSSNTDGLTAIVSKLDNLGGDMKKLKENVHAIQVGCQIYEGPHLDKECLLNEEVKQVEEAKYGEFRCLTLFNESNEAKYRVGPPGYYTRIDNRPLYREKRPSLEELMNKHLEESARKSTKMNEWINKLQESAEINIRNQSASLKNLETQIEQLTKELYFRGTKEIPSSSTRQCKMVNTDYETPTTEQNPQDFTLPCTIDNFNFYAMADLGASINVIPKGIFNFLKLTNLRKTNMLIKMADMTNKAPLGAVENVLV